MFVFSAIHRFLHSTIRSNHCFRLINAIVRRDASTLATFTDRTQRFLSGRRDSVFPIDREKYLTFIAYMREHAPESELLEDEYLRTNEYVFKLYHLPKKRNNSLLFFLLGYYVSRPVEARRDPLSQAVYLYWSIVAYRCRPSDEMRLIYGALPTRRFVSLGEYLHERFGTMLVAIASYRRIWLIIMGGVFGWFAGMLGQADFANVRIAGDASATSSLVDPSSLMYTFIVGEYSSDLIQQGISSFSLEKILMLAVVLFSVQAIRGNFKDLFVDSAISKAVSLFLDGIKSVLRLIFGLYSYVVWQTTTRYVFSFSNWHLRRGIIPSVTSMGIFTIGYILLYAFIIGCYVGAANAIFGWYLDTPILAATILGMTMLAVGMNFYTDKRNLETFILEIDTLYGHLNENKTETA